MKARDPDALVNRPARPIRFAEGKLLLAIVVAMLVLALAACSVDEPGGSGEKAFHDDRFPFTFTYPDELGARDLRTKDVPGWDTRTSLAFDEKNGMVLTRYTPLDITVTSANLSVAIADLDRAMSLGTGKPASGTPTEVGGYPGVEYVLDAPDQSEARMVMLFDGDIEYSISCQSTPELRQQVNVTCDQILATLRPRSSGS